MGLIVTLTGEAGTYLIRGAIWDLGTSSYRAYVHLVPSTPRLDLFRSGISVVSATGPTWQEVLDAAIAQVMVAAGAPVQNVQVSAAPQEFETASVPSRG